MDNATISSAGVAKEESKIIRNIDFGSTLQSKVFQLNSNDLKNLNVK